MQVTFHVERFIPLLPIVGFWIRPPQLSLAIVYVCYERNRLTFHNFTDVCLILRCGTS
jgi:hypothetical protein